MNRRNFLATSAGVSAFAGATPLLTAQSSSAAVGGGRKLGISIASYMLRWGQHGARAKADAGNPGWQNALDVLDHCAELGAGCLQIGTQGWTGDFAGKVRDRRESLGIALEGQIRLPRNDSEVGDFESELRAAKEAGASILRTVCLGGRRYEHFESLEQWQTFVIESRRALERIEPVAAKHGIKIAFENHKDWRVGEQLELLEHLSSEHVGATFDFGNNLALLEDPTMVAEALAPFILSTHAKDMAMAEYADGFLLSEVPLGQGILDLPRLFDICSKAKPDVWFNLEMITRDPLQVPVSNDKYWLTMASLPATDLARTLYLAKQGKADALPKMSHRDADGQLAFEEQNIRDSFQHARNEFGFA